ncbi:glycosyltransferase [Pseudomonas subflava]|uniref:glycosyltransferase n=1 Tax=Pseudomonas subflava TaxID=2952933 RepID=UPI00207ABF3E|nr:glycosyltransferase [Pseudomonas subflava]
MPIKYYGIYLCYAPTIDLRGEGLGRYLASFLKGASQRQDIHFIIACPSWSREQLTELLLAESVPQNNFSIASPKTFPAALRLYNHWKRYRGKPKKPSWLGRLYCKAINYKASTVEKTLNHLAQTDSYLILGLRLLPLALLVLASAPFLPIFITILALSSAPKNIRRLLGRHNQIIVSMWSRWHRMLSQPKNDTLSTRMYQSMESAEIKRMHHMIEGMPEVRAWYSPTAFWPSFNLIDAPKLMCVPDVVLSDFAIGFSNVGGDRVLYNFEQIEKAIRQGTNFVTYSKDVKFNTLINKYLIRDKDISVIHHAPNNLKPWISIIGLDNPEAASYGYSRSLLYGAIKGKCGTDYSYGFDNINFKFLFYASQLRANKNLLTLLRAYEYLLRTHKINHKLLLTCNPNAIESVKSFVIEKSLENDVLFLKGLQVNELAACYKLADLAINPSLSEGGCPFTFTEALSVDTPVVMAKIPVTEEVLTDPRLQEMTFFDPYDWQDLASRIEWALDNRDELLTVQRKTYAQLAQRTWADVVDEHLQVLERISEGYPEKTQA